MCDKRLRDMRARPILYLDLDDTIVSWAGGRPHAAAGAREFLTWALDRFEVRWLTTWCPGGEMDPKLLADLSKMVGLEVERLGEVRGGEWPAEGSKLNGVAWLEHVVLGRAFVWLEDDYGFGDRERRFLEEQGALGAYWHCNVTEDSQALQRTHGALRGWLAEQASAA